MKKYIIGVIVLIIVTVSITVMFINFNRFKTKPDFTLLGIYQEEVVDSEYLTFTSYDDFKEIFNSNILTKNDFKNNNYVLISIPYDECSEHDINLTDYKIEGSDIYVTVSYKVTCGSCALQYLYYLLKVDKNISDAIIHLDYKRYGNPDCGMEIDKPIIYLYPTKDMDIDVYLGHPEYITTDYPKYENGWHTFVKKDGTIYDKKTQKEYYGLYYEGKNHHASVKEDGFVVRGEDTSKFLEEKLSILGLNYKEANEFIIYWLPKLKQNKYNYIRFETIDEINNYMPLIINPTPDTLIRIVMDYKPLDTKIEVKEQLLDTPKRDGFTVVEWGGSLIK